MEEAEAVGAILTAFRIALIINCAITRFDTAISPKGFAESDVIIESVYETPAQEHAYLQPEAGISYLDEEGRITVVVAGQYAHEDREQITHALKLPEDKVRVIYPAIGGAFGGREDMSVQITLALIGHEAA
jgi:CO/xanthine dehydrogenase Mo-binding subunit